MMNFVEQLREMRDYQILKLLVHFMYAKVRTVHAWSVFDRSVARGRIKLDTIRSALGWASGIGPSPPWLVNPNDNNRDCPILQTPYRNASVCLALLVL